MKTPPLKYLFILHSTEKSGAPRATARLAQALAERGHGILLCFPAQGGLEEEVRRAGLSTVVVCNPPESIRRARGFKKVRLASARLGALVRYWNLARRSQSDVAWVASYVAILPAVACWAAGLPVVHHVHEVIAPGRGNRLRAWVIRRTASAIVFVARQGMPPFRPRPRAQLWTTLPNPIDPAKFTGVARDEGLRSALLAQPGECVFVTAAYLSPLKGIDILIRAFSRLAARRRGIWLWVAGTEATGQEGHRAEMERLAQRLGVQDSVRFLGHRDDIPRLFASADVFVLPSRNEAQPVSVIEAMMAGLPVIATRVGSVPDMIADGETGTLVPVDGEQALVAAMEGYASNGEVRKLHGANGRERAMGLYQPECVAKKAERIARRVAR